MPNTQVKDPELRRINRLLMDHKRRRRKAIERLVLNPEDAQAEELFHYQSGVIKGLKAEKERLFPNRIE